MKGVVLAGGTGSRLHPLTRARNKHLLPVHDRPMVRFAIELLVGVGLDRILIVTSGEHAADFAQVVGSNVMGASVDYAYQQRPAGVADALGHARAFVGSDSCCVVLGDNIFEYSVRPSLDRFVHQPGGARILLARVEHPEHYGVPRFDDDKIVGIEEKPTAPPSSYAVSGCYFYDASVFSIIDTLAPSRRGELEITDVNNAYLRRNALEFEVLEGYWADCGESLDSYAAAARLVGDRGANKPVPSKVAG